VIFFVCLITFYLAIVPYIKNFLIAETLAKYASAFCRGYTFVVLSQVLFELFKPNL